MACINRFSILDFFDGWLLLLLLLLVHCTERERDPHIPITAFFVSSAFRLSNNRP